MSPLDRYNSNRRNLLDGDEPAERELELELAPEPMAGAAFGSIVLHGSLAAALLLWGMIGGYFHHSDWGTAGAGGSIQVNLVSHALPLPNDQPVNDNVLATETPSQAPAPPAPKAAPVVDQQAIPIATRQKSQPQPKPTAPTAPRSTPKQQTQQPTNRAQYGEQAGSSMARSTSSSGSNGPASTGDGDFASRFGWYVDGINRKMATSWNKLEVDGRTPHGARVFLLFTVRRDGSPMQVQLDRSSGSPTLDRSCMRGVQRVDTFGPLPPAYNSSTLKVSYYCEY